MKLHDVLGLALTLGILSACSEAPTHPVVVQEPSFAPKGGSGGGENTGGDGSVSGECGGQTDLLDSRASLAWSDGNGEAIHGDGGGDYVGGSSGVHAKIFYHDASCARGGDILFDGDRNAKGKNGGRQLTFNFPEGRPAGVAAVETAAPLVQFYRAMQLGSDLRDAKIDAKYPGAPLADAHPALTATYPGHANLNPDRPFTFSNTGIPGCETLEYELVEITRFAGQFLPVEGTDLGAWSADVPGSWTIASVEVEGGHWAQCLSGGSPNGLPMSMPFSVTVTELPQP